MGRASGSGSGLREPTAQKFRKDTGRHHSAVQRRAVQDVHERAIARRQPWPWRQLILASISFTSSCTLLYLYLNYLAQDDDDELLDAGRTTSGQ
jgi:hypothetical protein